jgi:hypothetical protein
MAERQLPDVETLRKLLDYDPETGILTWKPRPENMFPNAAKAKRWNTRYAGKRAGNSIAYQKGYLAVCILERNQQVHRVLWALHYGRWPVDQIDHINGNPADNRLTNLREANTFVNCRNQRRPKNNTSGHVGVCFDKSAQKWGAYITCGKRVYLGCFSRKEDAVAARKAAEREYGFHPNHGRSS